MTAPTAKTYPVPTEEIPATDYTLTVDGQSVFTHPARVSAYPVNEIGAKTQVDEIRDLLFEDCDLIHVSHAALSIHSLMLSEKGLCRGRRALESRSPC